MNEITYETEKLVDEAVAWTKERMATGAGHDWSHIQRVMTNAEKLGKREGADLLVVALAAAMHDVVNLAKDHPERELASTKSAEAAAEWLRGKLEDNRIDKVYEAIKCHSFSAGFVPEGLEARVVSDADNLDAVGAIGIARAFEVGGSLERTLLAADDPFCRDREPDDSIYAVDHFYTKLLKLQDRFYTESGRQAARRRIEFMKNFLSEMNREISGQ